MAEKARQMNTPFFGAFVVEQGKIWMPIARWQGNTRSPTLKVCTNKAILCWGHLLLTNSPLTSRFRCSQKLQSFHCPWSFNTPLIKVLCLPNFHWQKCHTMLGCSAPHLFKQFLHKCWEVLKSMPCKWNLAAQENTERCKNWRLDPFSPTLVWTSRYLSLARTQKVTQIRNDNGTNIALRLQPAMSSCSGLESFGSLHLQCQLRKTFDTALQSACHKTIQNHTKPVINPYCSGLFRCFITTGMAPGSLHVLTFDWGQPADFMRKASEGSTILRNWQKSDEKAYCKRHWKTTMSAKSNRCDEGAMLRKRKNLNVKQICSQVKNRQTFTNAWRSGRLSALVSWFHGISQCIWCLWSVLKLDGLRIWGRSPNFLIPMGIMTTGFLWFWNGAYHIYNKINSGSSSKILSLRSRTESNKEW